MSRRTTFEDFVRRARAKHDNRYTYIDDGKWDGARTRIIAVCAQHGNFDQRAYNHLSGTGCPKCGNALGGAKSAAKRKGVKVPKHVPQAPFGALGGLYKLPFWD